MLYYLICSRGAGVIGAFSRLLKVNVNLHDCLKTSVKISFCFPNDSSFPNALHADPKLESYIVPTRNIFRG